MNAVIVRQIGTARVQFSLGPPRNRLSGGSSPEESVCRFGPYVLSAVLLRIPTLPTTHLPATRHASGTADDLDNDILSATVLL